MRRTEPHHPQRRGPASIRIVELAPEDILGRLNDVERKNAPDRLYFAGDLELMKHGPRVSVVGSRKVSARGKRDTQRLAEALAARNMIVVSGLAEGIDTEAHRSSMETGGRTVAVLGTPLDQAYPKDNRGLLKSIIAGHLAVSQFPLGYPAQRKNFPMRNRTMALLTDATMIVEAGQRSGTRHQGWEALRLGRLLFLLESVAQDETLTWPSEMIQYGAQVLSWGDLELVLDELPEQSRGEPVPL